MDALDFSKPIFPSFAEAMVSLFGKSVAIERTERLHGGDISKSYRLTLNTGRRVFMKTNEKEKHGMFLAETSALAALADTKAIATPNVLCTGTDKGEYVGYSFMLMDFVESKEASKKYWEDFAENLAKLHTSPTENFLPQTELKPYGFFCDNYIGATEQKNTPCESWIKFFCEMRLVPQFKLADSHFTAEDKNKNEKLLEKLPSLLIEPKKPSLLHGDLWSGNVLCGPDGKAMLIDPASYVGCAEADLAMTELFGGFPKNFYDAYKEALPLEAGYEERRDLYNLYHLLNHLNLFGEGYLEAVRSVVSEYVD